MKPKRIQRKRTKGWRMPPNTVYVGRGSKWGNPFFKNRCGRKTAIIHYRHYIFARIKLGNVDIKELKGKNLACWCALDKPCHADILLEIANERQVRHENAV